LIESFEIGWKANVKARIHSEKLDNKYKNRNENEVVWRAQQRAYEFYEAKIKNNENPNHFNK